MQGLSQCNSIVSREATEVPHNFLLREHCELVNTYRGSRVQAGLAPLLNGDIEVGNPRTGSDGSGHEIIVTRIE